MNRFDYFSSTIYREEIPIWVDKTLKIAEKHYEAVKQKVKDNVYQTQDMNEDKELNFLTSYFKDKSISILKEQGYATDSYEFFVEAMWGQEFNCNGSNIMHIHADSQLSGFYFLETPEGGSYPIFDDPRSSKKMASLMPEQTDKINSATSHIHFNNVIPGTMMMFNSWLPHMITTSFSKEPTKFIHFILSCNKRFF
jgi:uncharacterized protein (TIGR02466 family)